MPYSDLGVLLPTESQYGNPTAYAENIRAESVKQATYLSNMDQFYSQLDESKRQFDLNYTAREKEFSWTSGFEEKKLAYQQDIDQKRLALETRKSDLEAKLSEKQIQFAESQLGFEKERLAFEGQKLQAELEKLRSDLQISKEQMTLQRELGMGQLDVAREELNLQKELGFGKMKLDETLGLGNLNIQQNQLNIQQKESNFNQQLQYATFMAGVDQAYPQGVKTGYIQTSPYGTRYPETIEASEFYGKMIQAPSAYKPSAAQLNIEAYKAKPSVAQSYMSKWG